MKRFTETLKWRDSWFRRLKPADKLLWQWLLDNCDPAGVIDADLDLAAQDIGYAKGKLTLTGIGDRVAKLPSGKHWIPKFIEFQYGELSEKCPPHKAVFKAIDKHQIEGFRKGNARVGTTLQEKEEDKETEVLQRDLCTLQQAKAQAPMARLTEEEAEHWWHSRKKAGWTMGTAGGGSRKITSWQSDLQTAAPWVKEQMAKAKLSGGEKKLW